MYHIAKEVYEFKIIYGDTDSLFVTNVKKANDIMKFIAEFASVFDFANSVSAVGICLFP
jgi:DNA polymerase elongation subunit (family B)